MFTRCSLKIALVSALVVALALSGCATPSPKIQPILGLRVGMTEAQVVAVMGQPKRTQYFPADGLTMWTWTDNTPLSGRSGSILLSGGKVFQVPLANATTRAESKALAAAQEVRLREAIQQRDVDRSERRATEKREAAQAAIDARQAYVDAHPEMEDGAKRAILEERIRVGMTPEQVTASWGRPELKNINDGAYGRREQWVYPSSQYLYFVHGKLESWSRTE